MRTEPVRKVGAEKLKDCGDHETPKKRALTERNRQAGSNPAGEPQKRKEKKIPGEIKLHGKMATAQKLFEEMKTKIKFQFTGYYKYSFSFRAETEDWTLIVSIGGDHDDIYRFSVKPEMSLSDHSFWDLSYVHFTNKKTGETIKDAVAFW